MFNQKIKERIKQKIEYDNYILKEYLQIYIKLFIIFPSETNLRNKFTNFIKDCYLFSWLEYKLLIKIMKTKYSENLEKICLDIIEELDKIFYKQFNYNEYIFSSFEDAILIKDINRAIILKSEFETLSEEKYNILIKKLIK